MNEFHGRIEVVIYVYNCKVVFAAARFYPGAPHSKKVFGNQFNFSWLLKKPCIGEWHSDPCRMVSDFLKFFRTAKETSHLVAGIKSQKFRK